MAASTSSAPPGRAPPGSSEPESPHPPAAALVAAFAAVYVIWGSTYLAIRFAIETIPPLTMVGLRFLAAGGILYAWSRGVARVPAPARRHWGSAVVVGGLLLMGGTGTVAWAEQWVPSGLVALLVAVVPIWLVLLDWASGGRRPDPWLWLGLAVGLVGVALLVGTPGVTVTDPREVLGMVAVLGAGLAWAAGSIYSRTAPLPASPRLGAAMQMLAGGALLLLAGAAVGEPARLDLGAVSARSALALVYLVLFGSLVAFSAYMWLLRNASAARVGTYAYVNPVVALFLGWALAGEPLTPRTLVAAAVILVAVGVVSTRGRGRAGS